MSLALGIIAATLIAGEPPQPAATASISYTFRVVDVPSLAWRVHDCELRPLDRQGSAQVWLMLKPAAEAFLKAPGIEAIASPKLKAAPGSTATIETHTTHQYKTRAGSHRFVAASPDSAHRPEPESIRESYSARVTGRTDETGVLAKVMLDCTWVADVREISAPGQILTMPG